jgi:hypothetical protein
MEGGQLGSQAMALKRTLRQELLGLLRELAAHVQIVSRDDEAVLLSSGFSPASRNTAQTELDVPQLVRVTNVASTKLGLKITSVRNAKVYEVWLRTKERDWWLAQTFPNTRQMVLAPLTPGTLYEIRVRAVGGRTGYSRFTDPQQHMST